MDNGTQQLRFNDGKPKLTYLYSHGRALAEIRYDGLDPDVMDLYQAAQNNIIQYLAGGPRSFLQRACGAVRMALEFELGGSPLWRMDAQPMCDRADAAFCGVCVYGESKYERGNFRKGAPLTQYLDCALRHLRKVMRAEALRDGEPGVSFDEESGQAHGAHAYWNILEALDQPDWRDDRLPPVNGGAYDTAFRFDIPSDAELAIEADEETENHDYDLVELEAVAVPELEYDYYASYEPGCGCGMCEEIRPEMVEVDYRSFPDYYFDGDDA